MWDFTAIMFYQIKFTQLVLFSAVFLVINQTKWKFYTGKYFEYERKCPKVNTLKITWLTLQLVSSVPLEYTKRYSKSRI